MIDAKLATLHELRTVYDIDDLFDFWEFLELKNEAMYLEEKRLEKG